MIHLFQIFNKKRIIKDALLLNMSDIHSHVLPEMDDGCQNDEESFHILSFFEKSGMKKMFFTPHIKAEFQKNNQIKLREAFESFQTKNPAKIEIRLAAEYMLDEFFYEHLNKNELLTFDGKHVLVEMSYLNAPIHLREIIYNISLKGYVPIIAHPERYLYLTDEECLYLKSVGCKFQLNLFSVVGYYGEKVKKKSLQLLDDGFYDFAGSDIHKKKDVNIFDYFKVSIKTAGKINLLLKNNERLFI